MVIWNILRSFGICYGRLVIFGIFSPVLVYCVKKNLATLRLRMPIRYQMSSAADNLKVTQSDETFRLKPGLPDGSFSNQKSR
jgi:hypothetical protein